MNDELHHIFRRYDDELSALRRDLLAVGDSVRNQVAGALAPILDHAADASATVARKPTRPSAMATRPGVTVYAARVYMASALTGFASPPGAPAP